MSRILYALAALPIFLAGPSLAPAAVLPVTTLQDVDAAEGECSLREAIVAANTDAAYQECPAGAGADVIELTEAGTIELAADLVEVEQGLTLRGLGSAASVIDGGGLFEILHLPGAAPGDGGRVRIENLHLTGGSASLGGAIFVGRNQTLEVIDCALTDNRSTLDGGAIYADQSGLVRILRTSLSGNTAGAGGGALAVLFGDAASVVDSTFALNTAEAGPGGAIYALATGDLLVRRSTLSGNSTTADGGGLAAVSSPLRIESSTLVSNEADTDGNDNGDGGGISVAGAITGTLVNSILAGNLDGTSAGRLCGDGFRKLGAILETEGFNFLGANDCVETAFPSGLPNVNGDLVGTVAAPIDPLLEPLADNGGPTATHLPRPASLVVDQGSCPGAPFDQRGFGNAGSLARIVDDPLIPDFSDGCDIGSTEADSVPILELISIFADGFESGDLTAWSSSVR